MSNLRKQINDIRNSVNAGKKVFISKTNVQYNDWYGVGYIILDPTTGAGAYMISGGLAGAEPSRPLPTSQRELDALYKRICAQTRGIILETAIKLIGTPYRFGCKDLKAGCGGLDCSGLVSYSYEKAGEFKSVIGRNAAQQFAATKPTGYPFIVDLLFFKGSYDTNEDCYANEQDGITHVGIALWNRWLVDASGSGRETTLRQISDIPATGNEIKATSVICNNQNIINAFNNGRCIGSSNCYKWDSTGNSFNSFMGYRYAPEFDTCQ